MPEVNDYVAETQAKLKRPLGVCVPVKTMPEFTTDYSVYEKTPCPDCGEEMWLGVRMKIARDALQCYVTCAFCSVRKYGVTQEELLGMKKLTDFDHAE